MESKLRCRGIILLTVCPYRKRQIGYKQKCKECAYLDHRKNCLCDCHNGHRCAGYCNGDGTVTCETCGKVSSNKTIITKELKLGVSIVDTS